MTQKNQQRCLNQQPFSRQRAYLNRQKCQQKILAIHDDLRTITKTSSNIFNDEKQKFDTQQLRKLSANPKKFNVQKILKELDQVNLVINEL